MKQGTLKNVFTLSLIVWAALPFDSFAAYYANPYGPIYSGQVLNSGDQFNLYFQAYGGTVNANGGGVVLIPGFGIDASLSGALNFSTGGNGSSLIVYGQYGGTSTIYSAINGNPYINIGAGTTLQQFNSEYNVRTTNTMDIGGTLWCQWAVRRNGPTNLYSGGAINSDQPQDGFYNEASKTMTMNGGTVYGSGPINNAGIWNMSGGTISAVGQLTNSGTGTFTQSGGTVSTTINNAGRYDQTGGSVSTTIANTGTYNYSGGTFSAITNRATFSSTINQQIFYSALSSNTSSGNWYISRGESVMNMNNAGNITVQGGYLTTNGAMSGAGTITIESPGNLTHYITATCSNNIVNSGITTILAGVVDTQNGTFLNNSGGTFTINGTLAGTGAVTNNGTINLAGTYSNTGLLTNNIIFNINNGGVFNRASGTMNSGGTFNVNGTGQLISTFRSANGSGILNFGQTAGGTFSPGIIQETPQINIKNNSTVNISNILSDGTLTVNNGSTLNLNTGTINSCIINSDGTAVLSGSVVNNRSINSTSATITDNRRLFLSGTTLTGTGTVTNNCALIIQGTVSSTNLITNNQYSLNLNSFANNGGFTNHSYFENRGSVTGTGTFTNNNYVLMSPGTYSASGAFINSGTVDLYANYTGSGNDQNNGGIFNIYTGGNFNKPSGTLTNTGTFNLSGTGTITSNFTGSTGSRLNVGNDSATAFSMTGNITGVETISLVTSGSSITTNTRTISGVKTFDLAAGTTATITTALTGGTTGVINNTGTLNFNALSSIGNFQTLNAFSNSAINVNHTIDFGTMNVLGASGNTGSILTIANTKTLTTSGAINGVKAVTIGTSDSSGSILSLAPGATLLNFNSLVINGTLNIQNGASFTISPGENITGNTGNITNSGNFTINAANVTLGGTLTNNDSGVIQVYGVPTINFNGSFTNSGLIVSTFNQSNSLPRINIGTAPTLANGTLAIGYQNNYITSGTYTFIHSGVPGSITIGGYILPQPSTYIREWSLTSDGTDVNVIVDRLGFGGVATTPEAKIIGNYMESLGQNNPSQAVLDLLNALEQITDPLLLDAALISIAPPNYVALETVAMLDDIFNTIQGRLGGVRLGYASGDAEVSNGAWIRPFGSSGKQKPDGNLAGYLDRIHGVVGGIDNQITPRLLLGGAVSYATSKVTDLVNMSTQTNIKSYQAMLYSTYKSDTDAYLDTIFSVGTNNFQASRNINLITYNTTAESRYSGQQLSFKMQGSKNYIWKKYYQLTPLATAQYSFVRQLPYVESGAGAFNRIVEPNNINLLQLGIGAQFSVPFDERGVTSIPSAHAKLLVDVKGGQLQTNTQFISGGPILTSNVQSGKLIGVIGGALTFNISDRLEMIANYDFMVRQKYYSNSFFLNFRYTF